MAWVDPGVVSKRKQHRADGADERRVVAAGQVRAADRASKQRVADEEVQPSLARPRNFEADAAGTMAGCVVRTGFEIAERYRFSGSVEAVNRRRRRVDLQPEVPSLLDRALVEKQVIPVQVHGHTERQLCRADACHMVHVRVREQDVRDRDAFTRNELEQPVHLIARIDQHALARTRAGDNKTVLVKRADGLRLDYDHDVILAILDDLMFGSKIRSAAQHAGVTVVFSRSSQGALAQMRAEAPSLVILDLNNPRTDPLGTVAAMRGDAALASIPTLGYVSHVDTATIEAARATGVGEVIARSAFANNLPEILGRDKPPVCT